MPERIIHFAQDEKFINSAHRQFERVSPGRNVFYIMASDNSENFKYVKPEPNIFKIPADEILKTAVPGISGKDLVIFHSLPAQFFPIALALKKEVETVWFCYGYEIYNDRWFYSENISFDEITKRHFPVPEISQKTKIKDTLRPFLRFVKPGLPLSGIEIKRKAIVRMDHLASSFREEFDAIQKLTGSRKKYFSFWYYPIEEVVDVHQEIAAERPDVLVGNSGHATGNHLDVFEKIKSWNLSGRKITAPLSYGNAHYIAEILPYGKQMLGNAFFPLTEFYSLPEYNKILSRCGVSILNCRRQQAVGNTISLLWFGSKVFLSDKNPFFHYLRRIGVLVFSYESDLNEESFNTLLSVEEINKNRKILFENLNAKRLEAELKHDIDAISQK